MESKNFIPGINQFVEKVFNSDKPITRQFSDIFSSTINILEFSLQLFIISTIRVYEDHLIKDDDKFIKKTKPINELLRKGFVAPSVGTLSTLAKSCYYLIDDSAPLKLIEMKKTLENQILLGPISIFLTDLFKLFESLEDNKEFAAKIIYDSKTKKTLLSIINDLTNFRNDSSHLINVPTLIEDSHEKLNFNLVVWQEAFKLLLKNLSPILSCEIRHKKIDKIYTQIDKKIISINITTYDHGQISSSNENVALEDWYEEQWQEKTEIVLNINDKGNYKSYNLFPFIIFKDDHPYYYKKTKTSGYQYFSFTENKTYTIKSKKKFNRSVYSISTSSNSQQIFWTEVSPATNSINKIRANIPSQGSTQFIGRKKQIGKICEEIIEIPNQNGILYGPGGVGKTALLIELCNKLYEQTDIDSILYNNIIWVSAKSNFYNWEQNTTISGLQQFESLKNIIQIVLRFFDYEDVDEYTEFELKDLFFDLLQENKILLILDNFETVAKVETNKIIDFFGSDVKKQLKLLPNNFKVIITSRELIPSGYYQIKLEGLDSKESSLLINSIFDRYKNAHRPLTSEQCKIIHEATSGIPIVIKHCLGQIFEFQVPLHEILKRLSESSNEVIKFSYSEVLSHLKKDDCYLKILILLEIVGEPISARQISVILEIPVNQINKHLPNLLNFLCIDRIATGIEEKYRISIQIGLLAKSLAVDNKEIASDIRKKISENLTAEQRMDFATVELEIIEIFNGYKEAGDYNYAEYFLKGEIKKMPNSFLMRYHYALFLKDHKRDHKQAIEILKRLDNEIIKLGKRDPKILIALVHTYLSSDVNPDYVNSEKYCRELLKINEDKQYNFFVGEFLINWSSVLKCSKELDPIQDLYRKAKIKELATEGINLIEERKIECQIHKFQYLIAQGYVNQWNLVKAREHAVRAIRLASSDLSNMTRYEKYLEFIEKWI